MFFVPVFQRLRASRRTVALPFALLFRIEHKRKRNYYQQIDYHRGEEYIVGGHGLLCARGRVNVYAVARRTDVCAYERTKTHRDKHAEHHAYALKMPHLVGGRIVAHASRKQRHFPQISRHHDDARHRDEPDIAREKHQRAADRIQRERGGEQNFERYSAAQEAEKHAENGGQYEYCAKHQHVVGYAEEVFDIYDEIGHVDIVGYAYHADCGVYQIEIAVFPDYRRAEAVDQLPQEIALFRRESRAVLYHEQTDDAHDCGYTAEHTEEKHPLPVLRKGVEYTEYHEERGERHDLKHALRFCARARSGYVGYPGVERGVVSGRTDSRHYAVHNDDHHRRQRDCVCRRKEFCRVLLGYQSEREHARAPQYVAYADEQLALARPVRQTSRKQRDHSRDDRARSDHRARSVEVVSDRLVQIDVEIHILDHPGDLPDKSEKHYADPYSRSQFFFHFSTSPPTRIYNKIIHL